AISRRLVAHPLHEIADRHARVRDLVVVRPARDVHQRLKSAVAPAHDADTARVDVRQILNGPVASVVNVVDLRAAVIDLLVKLAPVADAPAILGANDDVSLPERLATDAPVRR